MKYSIVIPCYNEEENLNNLISRVKVLLDRGNVEVILVENGSKDKSAKKLKEMKLPKNIKVAFVPVNKGYGYGIQQGLKICDGEYVGWLHADMQVAPEEMISFMDFVDENYTHKDNILLKGKRKNRSLYDCFFTAGMTVYESIVLGKYVNDNGAIPVLFSRSLLKHMKKAPYNFSIELFTLYQAKKNNYIVKRFPVIMEKREKGASSWNKGIRSKFKLSWQMMKDGINIRRGKQIK